jgi:TRAP-type C4-dicarboxylate transport system permease large subunit
MLSSESLLGIPVQAFAETVIGFLVFGSALMMTGAGKFFINLSFALCGTFRGGAAKVCIFASGLLGMMSGSIVSNVLTAGTMTIPVMKRTGFRPSYAGAIEACASTGAVLAPPVMGATAFVIAQFLGVSYAEVALAATIPALLYYVGLFMQVDAYAARHGLLGLPRSELPTLRQTFREGWYYVFVIALLIFMLLIMKRESHAPFWATLLLLILNQWLNKEKWTWATVLKFMEVNGRTFVELIGILAGCGLLIGAFSMTGVISSLAGDLLRLAGDNALMLLAMTAITSLVLGLGLTTTACYIFLAILVGPALEKMGLNKMAVHMFVFYWGMLSSITPPVAIASFAAAGIAGAPAMKTGWESMRVGSIIYFLPFFFVFDPALVLQGSYVQAAWLTAKCVLGHLRHLRRHPGLSGLRGQPEPHRLARVADPRAAAARAAHHQQQRPFLPLRVRHADDGGLGHRRVAHGGVFQVDRADPFAAGLDHVLGAVHQLQVAVGVDGGHVTGGEEAFGVELGAAFVLEVAAGDPGAAHVQVAACLAVPGHGLAVFVHQLQVHAPHATALLELDLHQLFGRQLEVLGQQLADHADGAGLGHAPALHDLGAELVLEALEHRARHRRAADAHALEAQFLRVQPGVRIDMLEQHHPHRGHALREGDPFVAHQGVDAGAVQVRARAARAWCRPWPRRRACPRRWHGTSARSASPSLRS